MNYSNLMRLSQNITRKEADQLVRQRVTTSTTGIVAGTLLLPAAFNAYIWNKYVVELGKKVIDMQSLFPSLPDINYDQAFVWTLLATTALGVFADAQGIYDLYTSRQYKTNPAEYIRRRFNRKLVDN